TQPHKQNPPHLFVSLSPLTPSLDKSSPTRKQCGGGRRRSLATFDGPACLRSPALCAFKEPPGDASAHAHHVPPQCGTGAGEYTTKAGAVCAARNRRHHR